MGKISNLLEILEYLKHQGYSYIKRSYDGNLKVSVNGLKWKQIPNFYELDFVMANSGFSNIQYSIDKLLDSNKSSRLIEKPFILNCYIYKRLEEVGINSLKNCISIVNYFIDLKYNRVKLYSSSIVFSQSNNSLKLVQCGSDITEPLEVLLENDITRFCKVSECLKVLNEVLVYRIENGGY